MDRASIRKVAMERFCVQGYHATTLRQMAKDLGVTAAALYYHYPTKEELLFDLITSILDNNVSGLRKAVAEAEGSKELEAAIYYHVHSHCLERSEAFVIQHDIRTLASEYRSKVDEQLAQYEAIFRGLIAEQIEAKRFPSQDPVLVTKAIMGMGIFVSHWFKPSGPLPPSEIAQRFVDYGIGMLKHGTRMGAIITG